MRRVIRVCGQPVAFEANGATPRLYRKLCGRDIFRDMQRVASALQAALDGNDAAMDAETLDIWECVAFTMAHAAAPASTPDSVEDWLAAFPAMPVRTIFPELELLWLDNLTQLDSPSKK